MLTWPELQSAILFPLILRIGKFLGRVHVVTSYLSRVRPSEYVFEVIFVGLLLLATYLLMSYSQ